jgi:hypothetical protein
MNMAGSVLRSTVDVAEFHQAIETFDVVRRRGRSHLAILFKSAEHARIAWP